MSTQDQVITILAEQAMIEPEDVTLDSTLEDLGIDTAPLAARQPICDLDRIEEYLELHIEQGPILEAQDLTIGVVTGAQGQRNR